MKTVSKILLTIILMLSFYDAYYSQNFNNPSNTNLEQIEELKKEINDLKEKIKKPPKDEWDKIGIFSTLLSGLLVSIVGLYATHKYTERQRAKEAHLKEREILVQQIQTVEKFFPYLLSGNFEKINVSLQTIAALENENLALKLAKIFENFNLSEIKSSVESDSEKTGAEIKENVSKTIDETRKALKDSVVLLKTIFGGTGIGFYCTTWGLIITLDYIIHDAPKGFFKAIHADGKTCEAQVWLRDKISGFALISTYNKNHITPHPLPFQSANYNSNDKVVCVGFSETESYQILEGKVSIFQPLENRICIDIDYAEVLSGSPVITEEGKFIGVISEYNHEHRQAFLIPSSIIDKVFSEQRTNIKLWKDFRKDFQRPKRSN